MLITLAIKRVHNLSPHLSYVSTLPDIIQKLKRDTWDRILRGIIDKAIDQCKHGCVHV